MDTAPEINMRIPENKLKILSPDLQYLRPKRFFKYSPFNKTDIAKQAKINRKALYQPVTTSSPHFPPFPALS